MSTASPASGASNARWVLGNFPYYQADLYPPSKVDFTRLTHVETGNVWPKVGGCCQAASGDTRSWEKFATKMNRRAHQHGAKTMLLLGGSDSAGSVWLTDSASQEASDHFAAGAKAYAERLGYDGIDLDWEQKLKASGIARIAASLRAAWPDAVLSVDTGPFGSPEAERVAPSVDRIHLMTYVAPGNWGGWDGPWHMSPLFGATDSHPYSIDRDVTELERAGVPASKITIGVGFFGSGWSDTSPKDGTCPTSPTGGFAGESYGPTATDSDLPISKVYAEYVPLMTRHWDDKAHVPYLAAPPSTLGGGQSAGVGSPKLCYVSYDDQQSLKEKGAYVKTNGLGGVIIWTVPQGYDQAKGTNDALVWVSDSFR